MASNNKAIIIATVSAVEIGFGIIEGIVLPNIMTRKTGEKFFLPEKSVIAKTGITLLTTGLISGFASEFVLRKYEVPDKYRVATIAAVSIAINLVEPLIVDNVTSKNGLLQSGKLRIPTLKEWTGGFAFLTVTALLGGFVSDRVIAGITGPKQDEVPVLVASMPNDGGALAKI